MKDNSRFVIILLLVAGAGAGAWFFLLKPKATTPVVVDTPPVAAPVPEPPPPDAASEPAIRHPLKTGTRSRASREGSAMDEADARFADALSDMLGRKAVRSFLNVERFARGFVATVDNLATPVAPPHLWPVKPVLGHMQVDSAGTGMVISPQNAARYQPLMRLLATLDSERAARVYVQLYPDLQAAYEELGYPGKYFNDRVVEVIDHLLAAPTPSEPIAVRRLQVEGVPDAPHVFVFEDTALENGTAGEKLMLRVGPENAARIKAKLREIRTQIADGRSLRQEAAP